LINHEPHSDKYVFDKRVGAFTLYKAPNFILFTLCVIGLGILSCYSMIYGISVGILFVAIFLIVKLFKKPVLGLDFLFVFSFLAVGLTRIIPLPLGLAIDIIILLTWGIVLFKDFKKINWKPLKNILTSSLGIWALFCVLELLNTESSSVLAWFYAVRGLALNGVLLVPLIFLYYTRPNSFKRIINIWFIMSIVLGLYGMKQYWIGLFSFEQRWLDEGGHVTHVLWGEFTRMFSFSSDANQFGCSQAHAGIVALIFSFETKNFKQRSFYWLTAMICFFGMFISGTRGAIIIPVVSFIVYLALSKNFKAIILGGIAGGVLLYILAFTFVLHSVEPIRRMRTAFNATEDKSFIVRMENRQILANYLEDKPFGGGIGSAGVWGQRFSPNTFLANFETDGHYVRIHAETGVVGLYLYYFLFGLIMVKILLISWKLKDPILRNRAIGFSASFIGLMVANYSSAVIIALPSSVITFWSLCYVIQAETWGKKQNQKVLGLKEKEDICV